MPKGTRGILAIGGQIMPIRINTVSGKGTVYVGEVLAATAQYAITELIQVLSERAIDGPSEGPSEWKGRLTDLSEPLPQGDGFRLHLEDGREGDILIRLSGDGGDMFQGMGPVHPLGGASGG